MRALALVVVLGVVGCATGYHPANGLSGGFSEMRLNDRAYEVSFRGNGVTKPEEAQRMAMRRAADLTIKSGYTHFVVDDQRDSDRATALMNVTNSGTTHVVNKPTSTVRFRMLTAEESTAAGASAYDAALISRQFAGQ